MKKWLLPLVGLVYKKSRRCRWYYLTLVPFIGGMLVVLFDWHFVQHLVVAMIAETVVHRIGETALKDAVEVIE